jgi:hypothetical protein
MYPATLTFWVEPTGSQLIGLRRYTSSNGEWTCADGWHQAMTKVSEEAADVNDEGVLHSYRGTFTDTDPRWPSTCEAGCGYEFTDDDRRQVWQDRIYHRPDTGEQWPSRELPPGSMHHSPWLGRVYPNIERPDDIVLQVKLPNGRDWCVDSQASNCTRPGERHACWVRTGDPRTGQVTVGKGGNTCSAGAGSIAAGDYHGFLHAGVLTAG